MVDRNVEELPETERVSDAAPHGLIVCEASPLVTLAKAGELDVLLRQPLPIIIPDAVYREAARTSYDDAMVLMEWVETNAARVRLAVTQAALEGDILLKGGMKAPDLAETAAIEVTDRFLASSPDSRVVLLYEHAGLGERERDARVEIMSTGQLPRAVEATQGQGDDADIRLYAAGKLTWPKLQDRGWDSFGDVLAALGRLGLRYPALGPDEGSNAERRARGRAYLRSLLTEESIKSRFADADRHASARKDTIVSEANPAADAAPVDLRDVIREGVERDGDLAAREHLAAGRPIYYGEDDTPDGLLIKEHPDGRRELVRHHREGDEVVRAL